ncbi:tetratricopeptide repeat protein [Neptunomonas marina]|uniref:Uncharacterized protein n=1 Tax=Neptunomonas marina TaxID=1815562 RepID=A0A437Q592_9GAMM|nr:hypothetical protein [Neptunomonas marina]RVU29669.1 hypothetical protein EOE65_14020 [Neptunomonas marina]
MSLVNDMLRDLDQRQRQGSEGYTPVPTRKSGPSRLFLAIASLLVIGIVGFLLMDFLGLNKKLMTQTSPVAAVPEESVVPHNEPTFQAVSTESQQVPEAVNEDKSAAVANRISAINWMQTGPAQGHLTFWLDQTAPYVVHAKGSKQLDIELQSVDLAAAPPSSLGALLNGMDIIASDAGSRFRLSSAHDVEFKAHLKRDPARLQISVAQRLPDTATTPPKAEVAIQDQDTVPPPTTSASPPQPSPDVEAPDIAPAKPTIAAKPVEKPVQKKVQRRVTDASVVRAAKRLLGKGQTAAAQAQLERHVSQQPQALQSRYLLAQIYLAQADYSAVAQQLQHAPNNLSWALLRARAALQQGQPNAALQRLKAFPEGAAREDYLELFAAAQQQLGAHQQAVAHYVKLLELNTQNGRAWLNMGVSLEHLQQPAKARDAYQNALKVPTLDGAARTFATQQLQRLAAR